MKILKEYTLDFVRRNKKSSFSIMIAVFLTAAMLSCLCGFLYNIWKDSVRLAQFDNGNWHGELFDETPGSKLELIENFASVEAVMVKGDFQTGKVEDPRRDYIIFRNANAEYWDSMPEKSAILEGRIPEKPGELVISKQYFENHPEVKVGDTITMPVGERIQNSEPVIPTAQFKEGESFEEEKKESYTIVGILDATTSSVTPGYYAMGFLGEGEILPDDQITVYLRFQSMRSTYEELPKLAEALDYKQDEYGYYSLKYNQSLLKNYLIFSPQEKEALTSISMLELPLMILVMALMTVGVFVLIIHNAFALSANARLSQIGILSSIGASPKQIKKSVTFEALLLTMIPLPAGLLFGFFLNYGMIAITNQLAQGARGDHPPIEFAYGLICIIPATLLTLLTVWLSARIPAAKIAKITPIKAIRQGGNLKVKKIRKHRVVSRLFGFEGELAADALRARKSSYRTAAISLTLSFLLFSGIQQILACQQGAEAVYGKEKFYDKKDISLYMSNGSIPDAKFLKELKNVEGIKDSFIYTQAESALWLTDDDLSDKLQSEGGLKSVISEKKYHPIERDGKYRIFSYIVGLDDESFRDYCGELGIEPEPFYDKTNIRIIIYNKYTDPHLSTRRQEVEEEYLKLSVNDTLDLNEKVNDSSKGNYSFQVAAGHLADKLPDFLQTYSRYSLVLIVPMSIEQEIIKHYDESRHSKASSVRGIFDTDSREVIETASEQMRKIGDRYYGSGDYEVYNVIEEEETAKSNAVMINLATGAVTALLAVIGLSNVWSTVSGTLRSRKKEFAMLRSTGLSTRGLKKILTFEAFFFGVKPLLFSIPFQIVLVLIFAHINEITLLEYLPFAPMVPILTYFIIILLVIFVVYATGKKEIQKENIVDAIKDDTI